MRAFLCVALALALFAAAFAAAAQTAAPAAPADAAAAARMLAEALEDPEARAALIAQLQAAAGAEAAAPPASLDQTLTRALADRTLGAAESLSAGVIEVVETVGDWDALGAQAMQIDWRRALDDAVAVGIVMAVTFGLYFVLRAVTAGWRSHIGARAGPRPNLRKILGLAAIAAFELVLILVAWGAGYALAIWGFGPPGEMDLRQSLFLNAFLVVALARLVLRLATSPNRAELRLIPLGDEAAQDLYAHLGRIVSVLGYGMLLAAPIVRGAFGAEAAAWLAFAVAALAAVMAIRLILRNRLRLRQALMARAASRRAEGVVSGAMVVLAQIWHLLAIAYVGGLFVVWTVRPADSLGFMVAATLQSALAIAAAAIVMVALSRRIAGGVKLSQQTGMRLPLLEARLNALIPNALSVLRVLLFVAVAAILLNIWGLFALGEWLSGETGRRIVQGLLSAGLILVLCGAVWVGVASWIEYKITPQDGRLVRPREQTLLTLLRNAFTVVMAVMAGMLTLSAVGINIAPLIAGAGVIGLAIGFGAQRLVQDIITGVFIQFENAMNTGDVVSAGPVTGTVEKLTIRSVGLRDTSGTFHVVPFSSVTTVANFTRGYAYHLAEFAFAYGDDPERAKQVMRAAFEELRQTAQGPKILGDLDIQGIVAFSETAFTIRARIKTTAGGQWTVARAYSEILMRRLSEARIGLPFQAPAPPPPEPEAAPRLILPEDAAGPAADPAADPRQAVKLSR